MSSVIVTQNLRKSFPVGGRRGHKEIEILHGIDVCVEQGEFVGIFGPSGSGKSTLLHCMAGLTQASAGSVNMLGNELTSMGRSALSRLQREHVGFVFQSFCLIDSLNVADNVALPSRLLRRSLSTDAVDRAVVIRDGLIGSEKRHPTAEHLLELMEA